MNCVLHAEHWDGVRDGRETAADNKWEYKSCIFTINVKSGMQVAQISIDGINR